MIKSHRDTILDHLDGRYRRYATSLIDPWMLCVLLHLASLGHGNTGTFLSAGEGEVRNNIQNHYFHIEI